MRELQPPARKKQLKPPKNAQQIQKGQLNNSATHSVSKAARAALLKMMSLAAEHPVLINIERDPSAVTKNHGNAKAFLRLGGNKYHWAIADTLFSKRIREITAAAAPYLPDTHRISVSLSGNQVVLRVTNRPRFKPLCTPFLDRTRNYKHV
jgi:hypothetical protein